MSEETHSSETGGPEESTNCLDYQLISGSPTVIKGNIFRYNTKPYYVGSTEGEEQLEPQISVNKDQNGVQGIEVKCVCGRVIHIECD